MSVNSACHALILFSNGSLLCGAGEALEAHAARLRERGDYDLVAVGYLNYSEPLFAETAGRQVGRRRGVQTMARFFPVAFQGSRWGRGQGLGQSAAPRSRHLRIVSVLMPWCMARCRRVRWSGRSRRGWRAFVSICRMGHPRPDAAVKRLNWQACSAKANPTGSQRCSATRQLAGATQGRS
jgi:hypothetical protein